MIVLSLMMKNLHLQEYLQNYSCSSLAQKAPLLQNDGLNLGVETDPKPISKTPFVCILVIKLRKIKMQSRKRSNVFPTPNLSQSCSVLLCCRSEANQGWKLWRISAQHEAAGSVWWGCDCSWSPSLHPEGRSWSISHLDTMTVSSRLLNQAFLMFLFSSNIWPSFSPLFRTIPCCP